MDGTKNKERVIAAIDRGGGEFSMMCNVSNEVDGSFNEEIRAAPSH